VVKTSEKTPERKSWLMEKREKNEATLQRPCPYGKRMSQSKKKRKKKRRKIIERVGSVKTWFGFIRKETGETGEFDG